jgi:hypothetical protein
LLWRLIVQRSRRSCLRIQQRSVRRHQIESAELNDPLRASGCRGSCRDFFFVGGDTNRLDAQTLVRIESLLAIQTLYKFSGSLANRSSDAAGFDLYRPALTGMQSSPYLRYNFARMCAFSSGVNDADEFLINLTYTTGWVDYQPGDMPSDLLKRSSQILHLYENAD